MPYLTDIKCSYDDNPIIKVMDSLLSNKVYNDIVFDNQVINITVRKVSFIEYLYRLNWENIVLKYKTNSTYEPLTLHLKISLSEAIGFLQYALPSYLTKDMINTVKSVQDIVESLEATLEKKENNENNNLRMTFIDFFRIKPYQTLWKHDDGPLNFIREKFIDKDPVAIIDYVNLDDSMLINKDKEIPIIKQDEPIRLQILFNVTSSTQLHIVDKLLSEIPQFKVINVNQVSDNNISVLLYFEGEVLDTSKVPVFLDVLRNTYAIL